MIQNVTVIGSGQMGNGIAHVFAAKGYSVTMVDVRKEALDKALQTIGTNLDRQIAKGTLSEKDKLQTLEKIQVSTELKDAVANADLVIEAATENIELKLKLFTDLDQYAPEKCILATNTSSISITQIAA